MLGHQRKASLIVLAGSLTGAVGMSCAVHREDDKPRASQPLLQAVAVESKPHNHQSDEATKATSLSVVLQFGSGDELSVLHVRRVHAPVRRERGQRLRRGLVMESRDSSGALLLSQVVPDPRLDLVEAVDESGQLKPVASARPNSKLLRVLVPGTTRTLVVSSAPKGAWDGTPIEGTKAKITTEDLPIRQIASFELKVE